MNENKETIIIENTEKKILLTNNIEKKINDLIDNKPLKILENRTENSLMNDSKIMKNTLTKTQNVKESKTVVNVDKLKVSKIEKIRARNCELHVIITRNNRENCS